MRDLKFANTGPKIQQKALIDIARASPKLMHAFHTARELKLPDWWIVSGAIYNQVWNHLTDRPDLFGVKDIDMFYFDPDTSFEAEDQIIQTAAPLFATNPPIEIRNQARVHLWYEQHFGESYSALENCQQAIDRFACKTHCVGLRLRDDDSFDIYAPFGLNDIFSFRVTPNTARNNRQTHERKAARQIQLWPELTVVLWPDEPNQGQGPKATDNPHAP